MNRLLDLTIPRTLPALIDEYAGKVDRIECWVFEDEPARRAAEARFLTAGTQARVRSAYKPLLHFFLEDAQLAGLTKITVRLPCHEAAAPQRFQMEAYPLAALLPNVPIAFEPGPLALHCLVSLEYGERITEHRVFAPNRMRVSHLGETVLAPCGWVTTSEGAPIATAYETVFDSVMQTLADFSWKAETPYFDELGIEIEMSGIERRLPFGDECISTGEAMHEELYFALREFFCHRAGLPPRDRHLQMGQIIPNVRLTDGDAKVRIEIRNPQRPVLHVAAQPLEQASYPLGCDQIEAEIERLGGTRIDGRSDQGRLVPATRIEGAGPHFILSAGQHANEPSGVIGALRAAKALKERHASFTVVPLENPDGYALRLRLATTNPRHINHAARYTARGDDIQHRSPEASGGRNTRLNALQQSEALLHINLHGYPAHEFVRPFTGYLPEGSPAWAVPRGFFLIAGYQPGYRKVAEDFIFEIARRIASLPSLKEYNETCLRAYRAHAGEPADPIIDSICCIIHEGAPHASPLVITTEFPDETIYGDHFILGHTVQMAAALAAAEIYTSGAISIIPDPVK